MCVCERKSFIENGSNCECDVFRLRFLLVSYAWFRKLQWCCTHENTNVSLLLHPVEFISCFLAPYYSLNEHTLLPETWLANHDSGSRFSSTIRSDSFFRFSKFLFWIPFCVKRENRWRLLTLASLAATAAAVKLTTLFLCTHQTWSHANWIRCKNIQSHQKLSKLLLPSLKNRSWHGLR